MELENVPVVALPRTNGMRYRLTATAGGQQLKGTTSAGPRWSHFLARAEWHRGSRRLAVIGRTETAKAMEARIRRELRSGANLEELVVFQVTPE